MGANLHVKSAQMSTALQPLVPPKGSTKKQMYVRFSSTRKIYPGARSCVPGAQKGKAATLVFALLSKGKLELERIEEQQTFIPLRRKKEWCGGVRWITKHLRACSEADHVPHHKALCKRKAAKHSKTKMFIEFLDVFSTCFSEWKSRRAVVLHPS